MSATSHRPRVTGRSFFLLLLTLGLGTTGLSPAHAVETGAGVATGTEDEIDAGDPTPVEGSKDTGILLCARAKDGDYDGTTNSVSAKYTLDATGTYTTLTDAVYAGDLTITIQTNAIFHFGPQGTHYKAPTAAGNDCSLNNLGPLGKVPATITINAVGAGGPSNCVSTSGSFWRAAGNAFEAEWTATCPQLGNVVVAPSAVSVTSIHTFVGNLQPPCGLLAPCLTGAYTQQ